MKKYILILSLLFPSAFATAQQDIFAIGVPVFSAVGETVAAKTGFGIDASAVRKKTDWYYLGLGVDFAQFNNKYSIDIPNNLTEDESIKSNFKLMSVSMQNRFDLTPKSRTKVFAEANIGLRLGRVITTHEGYLLFVKIKDEVYEKVSAGISAQGMLDFYFPLDKSSKFALQFKTGFVTGSAINYIDPHSVTFSENTGEFSHSGEKKSSGTYWINAINLVIRFGEDQ